MENTLPFEYLHITDIQKDKLNELANNLFIKEDIDNFKANKHNITWPEIILNKRFWEKLMPKENNYDIILQIMVDIFDPIQSEKHPIDRVYELYNKLPF